MPLHANIKEKDVLSHEFSALVSLFYLEEPHGGKPSPLPSVTDVSQLADSGSVYL